MADPIPFSGQGGIRYGEAKPFLARAVDNGVCPDDERVLERTNEATKMILDALIPVGGMAIYDVQATGTTLLLPKELENAIEVEIRSGTANNQTDVKQGWYDLVNNFTYVDPSMQHDLPLVDQFLVPDPADAGVLRRQYDFPGLTQGALVRVTGAKRYLPITSDTDFLLVQNIRALKEAMYCLERSDVNDKDNSDKYYASAIKMLEAEVKKHLLDPRNSLKRRANFEKDLGMYAPGTFGWTRARIALELPGLLMKGKSEITRILEQAEMRLIGLKDGMWKGCLEQFKATVTGGHVRFPTRVESVLAAKLCGWPIDVRSIFWGYQKNGPHWLNDLICGCSSMLTDEGEVYDPASRTSRHQYLLSASTTTDESLYVVCKLRWVRKEPTDRMTIQSFEALRLMCQGIIEESNENWQAGPVALAAAQKVLDDELRGFIGGIQMIVHIDTEPLGGTTW